MHKTSTATPAVWTKLRVGMNPWTLADLTSEWEKLAAADMEEDAKLSQMREYHHIDRWPLLAAASAGVVELTTRYRHDKEGRVYAAAPFPLTSLPSRLRAAITSPDQGRMVALVDYRSSHWSILAHESKDAKLVADLSGDLYGELASFVLDKDAAERRKQVKVAVNAWNNGGGAGPMMDAGLSEAEAQALIETLDSRFGPGGCWAKAGAFRSKLVQRALDKGWAQEEWKAAGVALMRLEAKVLARFCTMAEDAGFETVLPLHDGALLSCDGPEDGPALVKLAAKALTGSVSDADTWATCGVGHTWHHASGAANASHAQLEADGPNLVGEDLRLACSSMLNKEPEPWTLPSFVWVGAPNSAQSIAASSNKATAKHKSSIKELKEARAWARQARARTLWGPSVEPMESEADQDLWLRRASRDPDAPRIVYCARNPGVLWVERAPKNEHEEQLAELGQWPADPVRSAEAGEAVMRFMADKYGTASPGKGKCPFRLADRDIAFHHTATHGQYDAVRTWLLSLPEWDGTERIEKLLPDYFAAEDTKVTRAMGQRWMLGCARRVLHPGCKMDTVLVLVGKQGARKTTGLEALAPGSSFTSMSINPADKDCVLRASRYAVVEWGELAYARRREAEALKQYLTLTEDTLRRPYAPGDETIPRRGVIVATTNDHAILEDKTGSRRFWPVEVGDVKLEAIKADHAQLWAEAMHLHLTCPDMPHWMDDELALELAKAQEDFESDDPAESAVYDALVRLVGQSSASEQNTSGYTVKSFPATRDEAGEKLLSFRLAEVVDELGPRYRNVVLTRPRLLSVLRSLGFRPARATMHGGLRVKCWEGPVPQKQAGSGYPGPVPVWGK